MIVAAGTRNRLRQERFRDHVDLLVDDVDALFLFVGLRQHLWAERKESQCCKARACAGVVVARGVLWLRKKVARELFHHEGVEREIAIEGVNHIVSISERIRVRDVLIDAV